ncbi:MAG: Leucyl/phenylalanyl-tRNA--protein transferase [Candidatus Magnetoglobus multicellularis str. Araruama]|uniref:Leucyl/phenylalanyl-tRNA--protein transferase n=1 Tax=Candidatus Magnetoglobus multicellularis str. Araruama TaxID=890399 RepID=A0A1V1PF02_9BACT|nr:MAG: Leucyl/phenylalanyl-tRNA--protein transferase [Candidatus Magnetoglobus multicellularis str. Araruama]
MRKVYSLDQNIFGFPDPNHAERDGLIAFGGDLSPERLLAAYSQGIFPWYSSGEPILWWSPDPRLILYPHKFHISKSLTKTIRKNNYQVTMDQAFDLVVSECANVRKDRGSETWITDEMMKAYHKLFEMGFAHSVETWMDNRLAGGLYGVSLGRMFFGESMFYRKANGSKIALVALVAFARAYEFDLIDCQMDTSHLRSLGAENIPRRDFLQLLEKTLKQDHLQGRWSFE